MQQQVLVLSSAQAVPVQLPYFEQVPGVEAESAASEAVQSEREEAEPEPEPVSVPLSLSGQAQARKP